MNRSEAVLEALDEGVLDIDADWVVRLVNGPAVAILGRDYDDLVGKELWSAFPLLAQLGFAGVIREAMATGEPRAVTADIPERGRAFDLRVRPRPGGLVLCFRDIAPLHREEADLRAVAEAQERLRKVAVAVAAGAADAEVFDLIAREVLALARCQLSELCRYEPDDSFQMVGTAGTHGSFALGEVSRLTPGGLVAEQRFKRSPTVVEDLLADADRVPRRFEAGLRSLILAPIVVDDRVWGAITVSRTTVWPGATEFARHLAEFAELAGLAIAGAEAKAQLARRALTDGLTDLANGEALRARVRSEIARTRRHGGHLCLATIDVDTFKAVNDRYGHEAGDRALRAVADALRREAREEDLPSRTGGDEFALLLVGADRYEALAVLERVRAHVRDASGFPFPLTVSAGICEWRAEFDDADLFRLSDDALYWSKASGRDAAWIYDADVVTHLDSAARSELVRRNQALTGLQALARAIDAKDPTTREHSERVADLARRLALAAGWSQARAAQMYEAGTLHDVGKVGIPDAILLKPDRLDAAEYEHMKRHAVLGAEIVGDVLTPEQVLWIRHHHERPDGRGYPDGITAEEMSDGAAILAVADTWDAMTGDRPYSTGRTTAEALAECDRVAGTQLRTDLVYLLSIIMRGELWRGQDSNLRRMNHSVYSRAHLAALEPRQGDAAR